MKSKHWLIWIGSLATVAALVLGLAPSAALALTPGTTKTVPTCNSFDATGTVPMYVSGATSTTLCTDLFGKGNYANSPLPAGPIDITPTGITIANAGSGYTTPTVSVTDFFGAPVTPAACSATVSATGAIASITCSSGGSGYLAPVVKITDPSPSATGAVVLAKVSAAGPLVGGMRKFVDALPDLKAAIATSDTTTFPGSDYYEIALIQAKTQMHSDIPQTTVRGYVQVPTGTSVCPTNPAFTYLGPVILAQKDKPVRVKFMNCLPTGAGGDLFIPVDTTYMGAGVGPDGSSPYLDNRGTLHLHGGNTPWISDGTPHQWTVPVGETGSIYQRGVSTEMVPDMYFVNGVVVPQCSATVTSNCSDPGGTHLPPGATNDPGQGKMTFYWTNQQSGRLMFYHDHAYGLTRLNVYAGEAAGYLLYDPAEEAALLNIGVPGTIATGATQAAPDLAHRIPLVIQDKTFVPNAAQLAGQDPTWVWGTGAPSGANGTGDLWFGHVYPPNQNPSDPASANAFGRWDYGAWFFPVQTTLTAAGTGPLGPNTAVTIPCTSAAFPGQILGPDITNNYLAGCPIIPNPSGTPESFMDTPVVNGKAYPVLHVEPAAYRFNILVAGNDRSFNLQLYVADATGKDVAMLPAVPPAAGTALPLCSSVNQLTNPALGIGLPTALLDATGNPLNGTGLEANCWPSYGGPSPGIASKQFMWPGDGRDGGVPDPRNAGPAMVQIGTEGGLLPAAVAIPSTPNNYEVNTRSITITNVAAHGLWLGPAERADVLVDFSQFAGKTLILYNDAPAPAPAFDMRLDYFTGDQDQTTTGGAPTTIAGYGPNTRTVMQIVVDLPNTGHPLNLPAISAGLPAIFAATQPTVVVPEATYPAASGGSAPATAYAKVQDSALVFQPTGLPVAQIQVLAGGSGYSAAPTVTIAAPSCTPGPSCVQATASATVVGGIITGINLTNIGAGYTTVPIVTITDATGTLASAKAVLVTRVVFQQKTIQELFTLDYGRMNATLGTELPLTNFLVQTTLPFGYGEWATEIVQNDKPQIWYLTHNGVDTHFIHFHLFNVQVINRVGWDGSMRPPDQNEIGWKDTVRMNPLENIIFAIKPITPIVPFPLPDSIRSMDPTVPDAAVSPTMSGINPATGNAIAGGQGRTNQPVNFGQEYVWHCHILGHEENDMMRAMIYMVPPAMPTGFTVAAVAPGLALTWTDNSASESSFTVQRDTVASFNSPNLTIFTVNATSANTTGFNTRGYGQQVHYQDTSAVHGATYFYRVQAVDDMSPSSPLTAPFQTVPQYSGYTATVSANAVYPPATGATLSANPVAAQNPGKQVTFTAGGVGGTGTYQFQFWILPPGGAWQMARAYSTTNTYTWTAPTLTGVYKISVYVRSLGNTTTADALQVISYVVTPVVPPVATAATSITPAGFTADWVAATNAASYLLDVSISNTFASFVTGYNGKAVGNVLSYAVTGLTPSTTYYYRLRAVNNSGTSPYSNVITVATPASPFTSVTLTPSPLGSQVAGQSVQFTAAGVGGSGTPQYQYWVKVGTVWTSQPWTTNPVWTWSTTGLAPGYYSISVYVRNVGSAAPYEAWTTATYLLTPGAPVATAATLLTSTGFTANWGTASNATGYSLDVSTSNTFATFVSGYNNLNVGNVTAYLVTGLTQNTPYYYRVRAKNGSIPGPNSNTITAATVAIAPVSAVTLTPSPLTSQTAGQPVQLTANATGGSGTPEYQFWVQVNGVWSSQPWTTNPVWSWNTTGLAPGSYHVTVYARNLGSTVSYQAWTMITYTLL